MCGERGRGEAVAGRWTTSSKNKNKTKKLTRDRLKKYKKHETPQREGPEVDADKVKAAMQALQAEVAASREAARQR